MLPNGVLLVDDNPDDIFLVRRAVERASDTHPILTFGDGLTVVDWLDAMYPDTGDAAPALPRLMLVDLKMPGMTGLDVLAWLRTRPRFRPMLRVIVSSSDDPDDIRRARALGADEYLFKYPRADTIRTVLAAVSPHPSAASQPAPA